MLPNARAEWCRTKSVRTQKPARTRHPLQHDSWATRSWHALQSNRVFWLGQGHQPAHPPNRCLINVILFLILELQYEFRLLRECRGIVQTSQRHEDRPDL